MSFLKWVGRYTLRLLPLAYMAFIWYLSSQPSNSVVELGTYDSMIKESLHLVEFAILYGLLVLALLTWGDLTAQGNRLAIILAVLYAFSDELHQSFIPSRSASFIDIVKDLTGITVVWYMLRQTYFSNPEAWLSKLLRAITQSLAPVVKQKEKQ